MGNSSSSTKQKKKDEKVKSTIEHVVTLPVDDGDDHSLPPEDTGSSGNEAATVTVPERHSPTREDGLSALSSDLSPPQLLLQACLNGNLPGVKALIKSGVPAASPEVLDSLGNIAFSSSLAAVSPPSEKEKEPALTKKNFICPLIAAIIGGHIEVVKYLLSCGCSCNSSFQQYSESSITVISGVTPLLMACQWKHVGVVEYLLTAGADGSCVDSDRNNVLQYACRPQQKCHDEHQQSHTTDDDITAVLQLLIQKGILTATLAAQSNVRDNTVLHSLALFDNLTALSVVLVVLFGETSVTMRDGSDGGGCFPSPRSSPLFKNDAGMSPLHVAVMRNSAAMVDMLLRHGFDPGVTEQNGLDAYHLAKVVSMQQSYANQSASSNGGGGGGGGKSVTEVLHAYRAARPKQERVRWAAETDNKEKKEEEDGHARGAKVKDSAQFSSDTGGAAEDDSTTLLSAGSSTQLSSGVATQGPESSPPAGHLQNQEYNQKSMDRKANRVTDNKVDCTRASSSTRLELVTKASRLDGSGVIVVVSRKANPYPKAQNITKRQRILRSATSLLGRDDSSGRDERIHTGRINKKKKNSRAQSPQKQKQKSRQPLISGNKRCAKVAPAPFATSSSPPGATASPFICGVSNTHTPRTPSANKAGAGPSTTPRKHPRTAHSAVVHRGNTAAKHLRPRSAWPERNSNSNSNSSSSSSSNSHSLRHTTGATAGKVTPAPSTLRGHRGKRVEKVGVMGPSRRRKGGQKSAAKLPARMHTSPSGVLTITFS